MVNSLTGFSVLKELVDISWLMLLMFTYVCFSDAALVPLCLVVSTAAFFKGYYLLWLDVKAAWEKHGDKWPSSFMAVAWFCLSLSCSWWFFLCDLCCLCSRLFMFFSVLYVFVSVFYCCFSLLFVMFFSVSYVVFVLGYLGCVWLCFVSR
jgi:hypothetical protein